MRDTPERTDSTMNVDHGDLDHDATEPGGSDDIEIAIVTMRFDAAADRNAELLAVLSKYVVLTRMADGCRNVDLCSSVTQPGRHLIVQKWESGDHQRAHFDAGEMVDMATSCAGLLAGPPDIDLWDPTSAHDLR